LGSTDRESISSGGEKEERTVVLFFRQIVRAAALDEQFYRELSEQAADVRAATLRRALLVVLLSGAAAGVGMWHHLGPVRLVWSGFIELGGWFAWAVLMYLIGTKLLPRPGMSVDIGTFLSVVGFSGAPGLLRVLGLIPKIDVILFFAALVWMLMAAVAAVKAVFEYTGIWQAVAVVVIGWVIVRIAQRLLFAAI
jgi:hypothetical protein